MPPLAFGLYDGAGRAGDPVLEPVRLSFLWRPMLPDVDGDMVLETAVNGRADLRWGVRQRRADDCDVAPVIDPNSPQS